MPIDIHKRAIWAQYVNPDQQPHAAAAPKCSSNPDWNPVGGVFIHHRGPADPFGNDYESEVACQMDVAEIYENHIRDHKEYDGDIAYNFLVCRHGDIYEGRGYERGEANSPGYICDDGETIGRNAGFYSICALMRSNHTATEAMLGAYRRLIAHLRAEAPRKAGLRILPHSFESNIPTECPGNLTMYAQRGSTIDPSVPWTGLADIHVFGAQRWVNAAYRAAPGYVACPEDGRTGWSTVLSLTQGLQHELGISPTVQNFGPGTFEAVRRRDTLPAEEFNLNLVRIYNAALWCKGYWTSDELIDWNSDSRNALEKLYGDAGLSYADESMRRRMWPHVVKALMRMDQFQLVPGGDAEIQRIQQRLNVRYVADVGIPTMRLVPCDGFYSRDVQQGLMMAVQYEIGIYLHSINGYFGPGTQAGLKGRGSGQLTGDLRYLFRAACYFNSPTMLAGPRPTPLGYRPEDIGTDSTTSTHVEWVAAFQRFSQIPVTGTNDYTTWAQLLVSCGDTARPATGCDCITQITATRAAQLRTAGYQIVGRYLDEHLPPTDEYYLDKALKPGEPQTILDAGLSFFPIFQYNGTQLVNFTYQKGYDQGRIAHQKAVEHRIPAGACIYFAVDYDALDVDIDTHINPYFRGVRDGLAELGNRYVFGVYGSRHVCTRVSREVGARWSLVSGMSWGYSGNLGFPLPDNWSFNQIREYEFQPGWGLDHDVWRHGADPGVSALDSAG
ncbi:glycoside hydrolase domain-containing protein [Micromonospora sp. NPDC126480]|uniref:glycoside hydrolase domain-containing protein n=1 Tax=Micromonospora sp. NPDC126480 TaxID=3155312 RepID=UPI00332D02C8